MKFKLFLFFSFFIKFDARKTYIYINFCFRLPCTMKSRMIYLLVISLLVSRRYPVEAVEDRNSTACNDDKTPGYVKGECCGGFEFRWCCDGFDQGPFAKQGWGKCKKKANEKVEEEGPEN